MEQITFFLKRLGQLLFTILSLEKEYKAAYYL